MTQQQKFIPLYLFGNEVNNGDTILIDSEKCVITSITHSGSVEGILDDREGFKRFMSMGDNIIEISQTHPQNRNIIKIIFALKGKTKDNETLVFQINEHKITCVKFNNKKPS